jgi:hypothetical protein
MSASSHTSSIFDMSDPMQAPSIGPDIIFYESEFVDNRPMLNPMLPGASVTSSSIPGYFDDNSQVYVAKAEFSMDI